jgi:multiple sugar transport system substrate-binding protein
MLIQRKAARLWFVLASIFILTFVSACGGGGGDTTGQGGDTGDATGGEPTTVGEAPDGVGAGPTATIPKINAPTAVTNARPTGVAQIQCQEGQRELVWLVRNDPVANPWEQDVVRPAFQQANPEICLNIQSVEQTDIAVRRATMIASGQPLHVWSPNWGGNGYASDRAQGLLENMTPLIEQDNFDTSVFIPEVLEIYKVEGGTFGLPFLTTGSYVYYNQKLLEDAGLEPPPTDWNDKSWTWDKLMQYAKKLTKNTENVNRAQYGLQTAVLNLEGPPMMWGQFIWPENAYETGYAQEGIDVTNEASTKAFQAFHDSIYEDKVAPDPATTAALDQLGGAFASGKVAMAMSGGWGHWSWKGLIDDPNGFCWGAAPMPWGSPNADKRTVIYTDPWSITSNLGEQERADAWTFVKFLVSEEQARKFTEVTGTPPTQTKLLEEYYQQFKKCMEPEKMKEVFEGAFEHGYESSNHLIVNWDELDQIWQNSFSTYFANRNANTEQMLQTVETQTNEALTRIYEEREQQ